MRESMLPWKVQRTIIERVLTLLERSAAFVVDDANRSIIHIASGEEWDIGIDKKSGQIVYRQVTNKGQDVPMRGFVSRYRYFRD